MKEFNLYNIECTIMSDGYDFPKTSNVKEEINNFFQNIHQVIIEQKGENFFPDWSIDFHIIYSLYWDVTGFLKMVILVHIIKIKYLNYIYLFLMKIKFHGEYQKNILLEKEKIQNQNHYFYLLILMILIMIKILL